MSVPTAASQSYCTWAEGSPGSPRDELYLAMRHVSELYARAVAMPGAEPEAEAQERFVDKNEHEAIYQRFMLLPFQNYGEVCDPSHVPPEEPTVGDLADDLLDIYADVKSGLLHYTAGNVAQAVCQWKFTWVVHWGRHATSALRAMHCYLTRQP